MPHTLIVKYDISGLGDPAFQQLLDEAMDLGMEHRERRFTPGWPAIRVSFGVSDRSISEVIDLCNLIFSEEAAASAAITALTPEHLAGLRYAREILANNPLRLGQDKVCQNHTKQCDAAVAAIDIISKAPV